MKNLLTVLYIAAGVFVGSCRLAAADCAHFTSCVTCRGDLCEWCDIDLGGNYSCVVNCPGEFRFHGECPTKQPCKGFANCTSCTEGQCSWCSSGSGDEGYCGEPDTPGCSIESSSCEAAPLCPNTDSCATCTAAGCSWCEGDVGPGHCGLPWECTHTCPSSHCTKHHSCDSCTAAPSGDCGWCKNSQTCFLGNYLGPVNTGVFCNSSDWQWFAGECSHGEQHP